MPGGRGLRGDRAVLLWLAGWVGPTLLDPGYLLGISIIVAERSRGPDMGRTAGHQPVLFPFYVTSPRASAIQCDFTDLPMHPG